MYFHHNKFIDKLFGLYKLFFQLPLIFVDLFIYACCFSLFLCFIKIFIVIYFLRSKKRQKRGLFGGGRNYATNCDRMSLKFDFVPLQISVKFPIFDPFWGSRDCGCFYTTKGDRKCKSVGLCRKYYASRVTWQR